MKFFELRTFKGDTKLAEGVLFTNGMVSSSWFTTAGSVNVYKDLEEFKKAWESLGSKIVWIVH